MRMWLATMAACGLLAGCGGGGGEAAAPEGMAGAAARVCEEHAKAQLDGKLYELDGGALAASMKDSEDGGKFLTAPIVIEPGLASETKQVVECTVRFNEGSDTPDVVRFVFNW